MRNVQKTEGGDDTKSVRGVRLGVFRGRGSAVREQAFFREESSFVIRLAKRGVRVYKFWVGSSLVGGLAGFHYGVGRWSLLRRRQKRGKGGSGTYFLLQLGGISVGRGALKGGSQWSTNERKSRGKGPLQLY